MFNSCFPRQRPVCGRGLVIIPWIRKSVAEIRNICTMVPALSIKKPTIQATAINVATIYRASFIDSFSEGIEKMMPAQTVS